MRFERQIRIWMITVLAILFLCAPAFAEEEGTSLSPENGIPLVIVYVDETQEDIDAAQEADQKHEYGNIQAMNESERHSVRAIGKMEIKVPEGYEGEYGSTDVPEGAIDLKYIRGRGNSTWAMPKKPYKIELQEGQDLFGMGLNKEWALMANYMDNSLLRNRFTSWIGSNTRLQYTPQMIPVDLVMVGQQKDGDGRWQEVSREYLGSYCLSESVEIGENRVEIDELKKKDTDEQIITGGYLLAIYLRVQDKGKVPDASWFTTPSGIKITNNDPEFTDDDMTKGRAAQRAYIRNYINELDDLIMGSEEITAQVHDQIAAKMDLESLADYWWIQEVAFNTDAFTTGSTYMYKTRGGKLCWGPLWDFDLAWSVHINDEEGYVTGFNNTEMGWIDRLREKDPLFRQILKERWEDDEDGIRKALLQVTEDSDDGILNRYAEGIRDSFAANQEKWADPEDPDTIADLDEAKEKLRFWIDKRVEWIDENLESIGEVNYTVTYETESGEVLETASVRGRRMLGFGPDAPDRTGFVFTGWKEKATGADHNGYRVNSNVTFVACYEAESDVIKPARVYLRSYEDWAEYAPEDEEDLMLYFLDEPIFVPQDAFAGRVSWTSSDESILSFDDPAYGTLKRTGDVTLTATTWNGLSADLLLHVYGPEDEGMKEVAPESMEVDPSEYTIEVGETIQVLPKYQPQGKHLKRMSTEYVSDNESVIKVDKYTGVLTGLEPGKANITVTSSDIDETISLNATFQVTVKEAGEPVDISRSKVVLSKTAFTYNGKVHKPSIRSIGGKKLTEGKDYTLKWSASSPKSVGKYTLTITGQGNYTGTRKASFKINPKGTKITSLKKASGSVNVKWKKQSAKMPASRITGYQIQLATNKKFTKNRRTLSVKGYKKVSKRVTGLKSGKKYYVHVRTYKTIKGKRYYSPWSKAGRI